MRDDPDVNIANKPCLHEGLRVTMSKHLGLALVGLCPLKSKIISVFPFSKFRFEREIDAQSI